MIKNKWGLYSILNEKSQPIYLCKIHLIISAGGGEPWSSIIKHDVTASIDALLCCNGHTYIQVTQVAFWFGTEIYWENLSLCQLSAGEDYNGMAAFSHRRRLLVASKCCYFREHGYVNILPTLSILELPTLYNSILMRYFSDDWCSTKSVISC